MSYTVSEISKALGIPFEGNGSIKISSISAPDTASSDQLVVAISKKYLHELKGTKASAALMFRGVEWQSFGLSAVLLPKNPRLKMAEIFNIFDNKRNDNRIIHETALIDNSAQIGENVSVGAFSIIGKNTSVGSGSIIENNVSIGNDCLIKENALITGGVKISSSVNIGVNFRCGYNTVIGSDGFSFVSSNDKNINKIRRSLGKERGSSQSSYTRIASLGSVEIGNDVEIGSNCSIDSGTLKNTTIGAGTKIDNLVHIGHNVQIGEDTLLCGQVGIAGSAIIGARVVLAGQCGVGDHTKVGDDVIAGGATKIFSNIPNGRVILGSPAMKMDENIKLYKTLRRLPKFIEKFNKK